jgi:hypothetical protein
VTQLHYTIVASISWSAPTVTSRSQVAMVVADICSVCSYCDSASLVSPCSPTVGLSCLNAKARELLQTQSPNAHAHVRATVEGGWGGIACERAAVLQPTVAGADGECGVRACGPMSVPVGSHWIRCREVRCNCIF